jgi:hypothetical protein
LTGLTQVVLHSPHADPIGPSLAQQVVSSVQSTPATEGAHTIFRYSMIELGLLELLILVLVISITLLRRYAPAPKDLPEF